MKKTLKKIKNNKDFIIFIIATFLLIASSFFAGFLIGEERLANQLSEESEELQKLINRQKDDLKNIKEGRNHVSPSEEEVNSQIEDLDNLREEVKQNN